MKLLKILKETRTIGVRAGLFVTLPARTTASLRTADGKTITGWRVFLWCILTGAVLTKLFSLAFGPTLFESVQQSMDWELHLWQAKVVDGRLTPEQVTFGRTPDTRPIFIRCDVLFRSGPFDDAGWSTGAEVAADSFRDWVVRRADQLDLLLGYRRTVAVGVPSLSDGEAPHTMIGTRSDLDNWITMIDESSESDKRSIIDAIARDQDNLDLLVIDHYLIFGFGLAQLTFKNVTLRELTGNVAYLTLALAVLTTAIIMSLHLTALILRQRATDRSLGSTAFMCTGFSLLYVALLNIVLTVLHLDEIASRASDTVGVEYETIGGLFGLAALVPPLRGWFVCLRSVYGCSVQRFLALLGLTGVTSLVVVPLVCLLPFGIITVYHDVIGVVY